MKHLMITGGCGFVGHHFVEHFLKETDWRISILDKLNYAAMGFDRVKDIQAYDDRRVTMFTCDLGQSIPEGVVQELKDVNYILHLAAETHVDNSIDDAIPFIKSNVLGTAYLLEFARKIKTLEAFQYFSTDEVFGPAETHTVYHGGESTGDTKLRKYFTYSEWDRYNSTNPYSASKAGGEELCLAYANTYGVPLFITHTMNVFGERQHPEKFIPKVIKAVLRGEKVLIHADATKLRAGSRFYIHARNVANAVHFLLTNFKQREKYNIVGEKEVSNLDLALLIAFVMSKHLEYELVDFHSSRPGHDLRYGLSSYKLSEMGWHIPMMFEEGLRRTVLWTLERPQWLGL